MLTENTVEQVKDTDINKVSKTEEKVVESTNNTIPNDVFDGDIDLSVIRKKRFRIDGDNNRYLELNISDMGIITRLDNLYPRLQKLSQDAAAKQLDKQDESDEKILTKLSQTLIKIDTQMRELIDELFDSNVSEVCAPSGSMIDPINGEFRFEHIIDVLSKLYTNNFNSEFKKMSAKMKKHTSKYTKSR